MHGVSRIWSSLFLLPFLGGAAIGCSGEAPSDHVDESADELKGGSAVFEVRANGNFGVTCTALSGLSWRYELPAAYRYHPGVCDCVRRPMAIAQNAGWRSHKTRHRDRTKRRIAITLRG